MAYSNKEEAGTRTPHLLRVGITHPALGGMDKESDRGAIADNEFFDIQNARRRGGRWFARPGQQKVNSSSALPNPITGLFDLSQSGPFAGSTGTCGSGGPSIWVNAPSIYDGQSQSICFGYVGYGNGQVLEVSPAGQLLELRTNTLSLAGGWTLNSLARGPFPNAGAAAPLAYRVPYSTLANIAPTFPGLPGGGNILNLNGIGFLHNSTFLAGYFTNISSQFASFNYTGSSLILEYTHAVGTANILYNSVQFRETMMWLPYGRALTNDQNLAIFTRDTSGNYTAVALTPNNTNSTLIPNSGRVDTIGDLQINCSQVVNFNGTDILYLGGWGTVNQSAVSYGPRGVILSWDGTSLKCVRVMETSPATCTPDPTQVPSNTIWGVTEFYYNQSVSPNLFYAYTNSYPGTACGGVSKFICRMGQLSPAGAFSDSIENFVTDPAFSSVLLGQIAFFGPYRGKLFLLGFDITGGVLTQSVMASNSLDLSLGWTIEKKFSPSASSIFYNSPPQLTVY